MALAVEDSMGAAMIMVKPCAMSKPKCAGNSKSKEIVILDEIGIKFRGYPSNQRNNFCQVSSSINKIACWWLNLKWGLRSLEIVDPLSRSTEEGNIIIIGSSGVLINQISRIVVSISLKLVPYNQVQR